jgi:hypothetical protein
MLKNPDYSGDLSKNEEFVASQIVDAAFTVHRELGPGLLEKIYEVCFCHELSKRKRKSGMAGTNYMKEGIQRFILTEKFK